MPIYKAYGSFCSKKVQSVTCYSVMVKANSPEDAAIIVSQQAKLKKIAMIYGAYTETPNFVLWANKLSYTKVHDDWPLVICATSIDG